MGRKQIPLTDEQLLEQSSRGAAMERFLGAAGRFSSGRSDISANHDAYLAEDFGE